MKYCPMRHVTTCLVDTIQKLRGFWIAFARQVSIASVIGLQIIFFHYNYYLFEHKATLYVIYFYNKS